MTARSRVLGALLALALLVSLGSGAAHASPPPATPKVSTHELALALDDIRSTWSTTHADLFTGVWVNGTQAYVAVVDPKDPRVGQLKTAFPYPSQLSFAPAKATYAELRLTQDAVNSMRGELAALGAPLSSTDIDVKKSVVVAGLLTVTQPATERLRAIFGSRVVVEQRQVEPAVSLVPGGSRVTGGGHRCTAAFNLSDSAFLTAGHCFAQGSTVYRNEAPVGTVTTRVWTTGQTNYADIEIVDYISDVAPTDNVLAGDRCGGCRVTITGVDTTMILGSTVCSIGDTSGTDCGTIKSADYAVCYDGVYCFQGLVTVTGDDYCPGDSGGPIFYGQLAKGIISGRTWSGAEPACGGATGIFSGMNHIQKYMALSRIRTR
jgi:hypothetical protein